MAMSSRKWLLWSGGLLFFLALQLIPVDRSNPPVEAEPNWDSPQTKTLARAACYDCHSNETEWPWYSYVAPFSWWTSQHVQDGRFVFNMSEEGFGRFAGDAAEVVESGTMPIWPYDWMHPEARLTDAQRAQLVEGLRKTFEDHPDVLKHH